MALAYGSFHELSHQLRFLLFEMGIALPQQHVDYYITLVHRTYLKKLQDAAIQEGFIASPIITHHVHDFLEQLSLKLKETLPESRFFAWDKLYHQCNETIANTALAQAYKKCWDMRLSKELAGYPNLWQWIEQQTAEESLLFLDQWGCLNQRICPSLHEVSPYTRREVLQYSAEFQAQFSIHWAAVKKTKVLSLDRNKAVEKEFPQEYASWQQKISLHHVDVNHYQPIPVHPWLWRSQLQSEYVSMIDSKELILLPHHQKVRPSMAANMVMPLKNSAHLKLTAENNSIIEDVLRSLLLHEQNYSNTLFLTPKSLTVKIESELSSKSTLGFSIIQSPNTLINNEQKIIPLTSLFAQSPLTQQSLIDGLIQASNLNPITYFTRYCHKLLSGPLHLFLKHGLSFSTEAEQMAVIFKNHLPQGLILRDVQHISMKHYISLKNKKVDIPESLTNDKLRKEFIASMLQNNIYYWVEHLHREYQIERHSLWSQVKQVLDYLFLKLNKDFTLSTATRTKK